jgi:ATP-binding cassette subfamily B protein
LSTVDRSLLSTYLRPEWRRGALLCLLLLTGIALQLANPEIIKLFIDGAQNGKTYHYLVLIGCLFLAVALAGQVAAVAETRLAEDLGWRTTNNLRIDLTSHVLSLDAGFHSDHTAGDLIERIDGDVSAIADFFARFVTQVMGSSIFLVGVIALLFATDWRVGATVASFSALAVVLLLRGGGRVAARAADARRTATDLSSFIEERMDGLPDIKANGADEYVVWRLHQRLRSRCHAAVRASIAVSTFEAGVGSIFALAAGAALGLSALLHQTGTLTLGTIFLVFRYTGMLQTPLEQLTTQMNTLQQATASIVRVRRLQQTVPGIVSGGRAGLPSGAFSVVLHDVTFAYRESPILRNVSLEVAAGETLGLLGRTGCGKTTISRLIFRLYDPQAGMIRLNGVDVRTIDLDHLRARVAIVTQEVQLFQTTLRDNVRLFDESIDDGRIMAAFELLELTPWLDQLPHGLDTSLGSGGRGVSAGEAQLIAFARVYLRDPGLVILDEASSRVDPYTQRLLERGTSHLVQDRTAIIIAHRPETIRAVDSIAILAGGEIVEAGSRAELERDPTSRLSAIIQAGNAEVDS